MRARTTLSPRPCRTFQSGFVRFDPWDGCRFFTSVMDGKILKQYWWGCSSGTCNSGRLNEYLCVQVTLRWVSQNNGSIWIGYQKIPGWRNIFRFLLISARAIWRKYLTFRKQTTSTHNFIADTTKFRRDLNWQQILTWFDCTHRVDDACDYARRVVNILYSNLWTDGVINKKYN